MDLTHFAIIVAIFAVWLAALRMSSESATARRCPRCAQKAAMRMRSAGTSETPIVARTADTQRVTPGSPVGLTTLSGN